MMQRCNYSSEHEAVIAKAVTYIACDLRLIDVKYLISFITLQMHNHVADHVTSSAERYFAPGFISLGSSCDLNVDWDGSPEITIDLILNMGWTKVYFSLLLQADQAIVRLNYLSKYGDDISADEVTLRLQRTIEANMIS